MACGFFLSTACMWLTDNNNCYVCSFIFSLDSWSLALVWLPFFFFNLNIGMMSPVSFCTPILFSSQQDFTNTSISYSTASDDAPKQNCLPCSLKKSCFNPGPSKQSRRWTLHKLNFGLDRLAGNAFQNLNTCCFALSKLWGSSSWVTSNGCRALQWCVIQLTCPSFILIKSVWQASTAVLSLLWLRNYWVDIFWNLNK